MSIDASLKSGGSLGKHRNVLTRNERIAKLSELGKFDAAKTNPLGLPKVGNRKPIAGGGKTKKKDAAAEGAAATPAAGAAKK